VKKSFGIVMWLGAVYYLSPQLSTATTALLTAGVLLSTAVFAWPSPEDGEGVFLERLRQLYTVSAGLVGAYLLVGTLVHEGFILPPMQVASASAATAGPSAADIQWVRSETDGLAQAAKEGKPVMVDFTAEWCALCHEMEKTTYRDPRVVAASKDFVMVMVDVTKTDDPAIAAILRKYDVVGPPKVVFLKPDGTHMDATQGYVAADDFLPHMQAAVTAAKG
jgi:thiol:disulfide interchange protein DsbD